MKSKIPIRRGRTAGGRGISLRGEGPKGGENVKIGLDVGSTTIKCVVLDEREQALYSTYERHYSHILEKAEELLRRIARNIGRGRRWLSPVPPEWAWRTA